MALKFSVTPTPAYDASLAPVWHYRLRAYSGPGTASVIESKEAWPTHDEAEAACKRANAGDQAGLTFATYADD